MKLYIRSASYTPEYQQFVNRYYIVKQKDSDKYLGSNPKRLVPRNNAVLFTSKEDAVAAAWRYIGRNNLDNVQILSEYFNVLPLKDVE